MKNGTYTVSFEVNLSGAVTEEEAIVSIKEMVEEMISKEEFPELNFELTEEEDPEYHTEEAEVQELNFG
jgi:hypothetical protein